jgi:hypothetical protein
MKTIQFTKPKAKKIQYTSVKPDVQQDSLEEIEAISAFSKSRSSEKDLFKANTDANYFTVITFNNSDQLDEFIQKLGIKVEDKQYINGNALAKKLGIEITTPNRKAPGNFKISKKLLELV